ncbi:MAG: DUF3072 domain-containing protein [Thermoproteota archaeon]|nr:DUF3072 domain-containing protein [Thermoproteota archaeon]
MPDEQLNSRDSPCRGSRRSNRRPPYEEEPMTGPQRSYLKALSEEAGEPFYEHLTKAQASKRIEELQQKTGRGVD